MKRPPLDPDFADLAPSGPALTAYDEEHAMTYIRMLDADAEGADWREVTRIALHIDPEREPERARRAFESHLARAKRVAHEGYRQLLRGGASRSFRGPLAPYGSAMTQRSDLDPESLPYVAGPVVLFDEPVWFD